MAGIPLAVALWDDVCLRLAQGIGICLSMFNPAMLLLGTAAVYACDFLLDKIRVNLPRFAWREFIEPCDIRIASLGHDIGDYAGAAIALYRLSGHGLNPQPHP